MKKALVLAIVIVFFLCLTNQNAQDFTWKKTKIPSVGIKSLAISEEQPVIIAITNDNRLYGLTYNYNNDHEYAIELHPDSLNIEITAMVFENIYLILGTKNKGIYVSPNGIVNWLHFINGLEDAEITSIIFCNNKSDSNFTIAGTKHGLYRTFGYWSNYIKLNNEINDQEIIAIFNPDKIHFSEFIKIFVSTKDSGVYESNDKGYTYQKINYPFSKEEIIRRFYSTYDTIFAVSDRNIYLYDVFGDTTWKKLDINLPSQQITSFICYNYDSTIVFQSNKDNSTQSLPDLDKMMIGTYDKGIMNLTDSNWVYINEGLNDKHIISLVSDNFYFITGNLFAGTESDGVYRIQLKLLPDPYIVLEDINSTDLTIAESNDWLVKLILNLTTDEYVNLELYDLQGNKVKDIFKDYLSEGEHNLDLDISGLQSGIYFIKLQMNGRNTIKKMMVVR